MDRKIKWARAALAAGALITLAPAAFADDPGRTGRALFDRHCRTCHGITAPADLPIGPDLAGLMGARAGTRAGGTHSRAMTESSIVWDRATLRGFLARPRAVIPRAMMPDGLQDDAADVERLLDYLETLR